MAKFIPVEPEKWAEMVKALALVKKMDKTINASQAECRRLKAQVERLREAGDAIIQNLHPEEGDWCFEDAQATWSAAKMGEDR